MTNTAMTPGAASPHLSLPAALPKIDVQKLRGLQQDYLRQLASLWTPAAAEGNAAPLPDRRFADAAWTNNPVASLAARAYLLNSQALLEMADAVEGDAKTRARIRFAVEQFAAACAPSNFLALNAEAQQKALETQGASIGQGVRNLVNDLRQGHMQQTDETRFEVGRNVATTEGAVVYENELFQLIEYRPLTARVHARPLLMVPPCINKFYILDLQPANSLVRHMVAQGHRTYMVSWRNPDESLARATWDDYVSSGVIQAIAAVRAITGSDAINALGFCVGGTLLATALSVLAAKGEKPVASATLLTTFLDFSDTGVLDLFIDEAAVRMRELQFAGGGLLPGRELASTFSFLRPNELVWNYVVGNYLKGETPPPFDLLYWNSDATNLPGPFYAWYLRNTYLENRLKQPGAVSVCGVPVDLSRIDIPVYLYGSREDHIVPVGNDGGGAYASTRILPGPKRFVMGASGHIAGVINPPAKKKRSYWVRDDGALPEKLSEWSAGATEKPGSWWDDWTAWLAPKAGPKIPAPRAYGSEAFPPIEPAPGRYVQQKV
jgi:polyhydroxyalkanoate synthase